MNQRRPKPFWISLLVFATTAVLYQNCSPIKLSSEPSLNLNKSSDNGGPYSGLQKIYRHFDLGLPCTGLDLNGNPLPNTEILIRPDDAGIIAPYLAREQCADLPAPTQIAAQDLIVSTGPVKTLSYKNVAMTSQNAPGPFDVVKAQCPAGTSAIPGAVRTNLFLDSLDWTAPPVASGKVFDFGWSLFPGVQVNLFSTIQSLPAFMIYRNDPTLLDLWRRQSQYLYYKANTRYAFSFVTQAGSIQGADVHLYRGMNKTPGPTDETALVTFDFKTSVPNIQYAVNMPGMSATMTPFGSGFLCTVYFTSSATAPQGFSNIGVGPTTFGQSLGQVGDSVVATAAQLVEVNDFCK